MTLLDPRVIDKIDRTFRAVLCELDKLHTGELKADLPSIFHPTYEVVQYALFKEGTIERDDQGYRPGTSTITFWPTDEHSCNLFWVPNAWIPPAESPPYPTCHRCGSVVCLMVDDVSAIVCLERETYHRNHNYLVTIGEINDDDIPF